MKPAEQTSGIGGCHRLGRPIDPAMIWGLFFSALVIGAIFFGSRQLKVVVVHGQHSDEQAVKAFDAGVLSGMHGQPGIHFRSLSVAHKGDSPLHYCPGVWYALTTLDPDLLIIDGEKAQRCIDDPQSGMDQKVPRVIVDGKENKPSGLHPKQIFLRREMPLPTWSDALRSQRGPDKDYHVMFLAEDSALARAQQKAYESLTLARVVISTRLVTSWAQWEHAARQASPDNDLLVMGSYGDLNREWKEDSRGLHDPVAATLSIVKMTRAAFGNPIAATEVRSVTAGAAWAIEPEPGSVGRRAGQTGLILLGESSSATIPAQTLSIAVDPQWKDGHHGLPPLFEAVARNQGLYR